MNLLKNDMLYCIEVYPLGICVCPAPGKMGIPMDAMRMVGKIAPRKSVVDAGIANALDGILAAGALADCKKWRGKITMDLAMQPISKDLKWIRGVDCGQSSTTLFLALTKDDRVRGESMALNQRGERHHPRDADDFGRCVRMIAYMGWENRVQEAAGISREWALLVSRWGELTGLYAAGDFEGVTELIWECVGA